MPDSWTVGATVLRVDSGGDLSLRLDLGWRLKLDVEARLIGVHVGPDDESDARRYLIGMLHEVGGAQDGSGAEVTFVCHVLTSKVSLGQVLVTTPQGASYDLGMMLLQEELAAPSEL
jgi:hypothetical protein